MRNDPTRGEYLFEVDIGQLELPIVVNCQCGNTAEYAQTFSGAEFEEVALTCSACGKTRWIQFTLGGVSGLGVQMEFGQADG